MASSGAKVLQTRSVAMAMRHNVNLQVLSSFTNAAGTFVVSEDSVVEQETISELPIVQTRQRSPLLAFRINPVLRPRYLARWQMRIECRHDCAKVPTQTKTTDISFSLGRADLDKAVETINGIKAELGFDSG